MLFNSFPFILAFLPATLIVFHLVRRTGSARLVMVWLTAASLFFYGWWNPVYLPLLVGSVAFNYVMGLWISSRKAGPWRLAVGVTGNLALLGYFKYAGFFATTGAGIFGSGWRVDDIVLPLAISFFTFQQIAYLADAHRGRAREPDFLRYCLFVSFFPQLIAGPMVHHSEMLPQLASKKLLGGLTARNLAVGGTIFAVGLGKKVLLADSLGGYADPIFDAAARGEPLATIEAWGGTLAYALQIYFDFSGYSDMAIGLAAMVGIRLPLNFNSPYQATGIVDFWRRWHMTLGRFFRDQVYIPLGGNRRGVTQRSSSLMVTALLAGFWHGAGWSFVLWGGLHGIFLVVNHLWTDLTEKGAGNLPLPPFTGRVLTLTIVILAWVPFRADNSYSAINIFGGLRGGLVCLNSAARFDKWNRAAVR